MHDSLNSRVKPLHAGEDGVAPIDGTSAWDVLTTEAAERGVTVNLPLDIDPSLREAVSRALIPVLRDESIDDGLTLTSVAFTSPSRSEQLLRMIESARTEVPRVWLALMRNWVYKTGECAHPSSAEQKAITDLGCSLDAKGKIIVPDETQGIVQHFIHNWGDDIRSEMTRVQRAPGTYRRLLARRMLGLDEDSA